MVYFLFYNTYFLIKNIPPANTINITVPYIVYIATCPNIPVVIDSNTDASSISSSPGTLLSGVESLSGIPQSLWSSEISAVFVFNPKLLLPFIHLNITVTSALSPGCNNVFSNNLVDITLFPSSVHPSLSSP